MATKQSGKGGKPRSAKTKSTATRDARSAQRSQLGTQQYLLGPQDDGSIVLLVANDFDLMILRKACEKQKKNATAATGTVSALADGEDPFIDAVERSLDRLVSAINRSRSPENQIAGTPIGDVINSATGDDDVDASVQREVDANDANADASDVHHDGTRRWSNAIPRPRPKAGDLVQLPKGELHEVVDALGFKGDGLMGSESSDELQKLADEGKLTGVFEIVVKDVAENTFVRQQPLHHDSSVTFETWRIPGHDDDYAALDAREAAGESVTGAVGNIATSVSEIVEEATTAKSGKASTTPKRGVTPAPKPSSRKPKRK